MCNIICISNRKLCTDHDDFISRINKISALGIPVILREKDLPELEYTYLLNKLKNDMVIPHFFTRSALKCGIKKIHLPLDILRAEDTSGFDVVGCSVHSPQQAYDAYKNGATYVTAGHIFATDCKKGVPPRGLELIKNITDVIPLPVYAIGGISPDNAHLAIESGASGVCIMSGLMKCDDLDGYINKLKNV